MVIGYWQQNDWQCNVCNFLFHKLARMIFLRDSSMTVVGEKLFSLDILKAVHFIFQHVDNHLFLIIH